MQFLYIAKGLAGEVRSLSRVAWDVGYIEKQVYGDLHAAIMGLSRVLANQIKAIKAKDATL